ncbi:hypothetical protein K435DRAFT_974580 [Dendrothele bispora CBS 962.96]|uniref:Uncharacterized protein n=1 Tax=Dendrothele bispora (strain CBS 962.96) TaxID=1314807 RepID=A0A4S8KKY1_DENBC|nr:hypothetical protein K435DRAFT_974580 [Dendrothele bispora CBS 962.96]
MPLITPVDQPPPPPVHESITLKHRPSFHHHAKTEEDGAEHSNEPTSMTRRSEHSVSSQTKLSSPRNVSRKAMNEEGTEEDNSGILCRIPTVQLDVDVVTDGIAAKLATSFLGHILFLKSQVPFPVLQLARLPGAKADSRAAKQKRELLDSFDTISSHLDTTFTALSTALARTSTSTTPKLDPKSNLNGESVKKTKRIARAYMAILLGPSIGTAKRKVIFGVDGLEVKVWGEREDSGQLAGPTTIGGAGKRNGGEVEEEEDSDAEQQDEDEQNEEVESEEDVGSGDEDDDSDVEEPEESGSEEESDEEEEEEEMEEPEEDEQTQPDDSPVPPPSTLPLRPPTPPRSLSRSTSSNDTRVGNGGGNGGSSANGGPKLMSVASHAEEQQAIRVADRLLSRTLAKAEGEGMGMAEELALMQTHVLILAPRRFNHPAWIPRQNVSKALDKAVIEFLGELGKRGESENNVKKQRTRPVEGVWVSASSSRRGSGSGTNEAEEGEEVYEYLDVTSGRDSEELVRGNEGEKGQMEEEDDMIWWSWDGKLIGTGGF